MCGRFALTASAHTLTTIFQVDVRAELLPRYNIAPTQDVLGVVVEAGARTLGTFRWGLIPSWSKDRAIAHKTINARGETAASKPAFRTAFRHRRMLVVADGFYEWTKTGTHKLPTLLTVDGGRPFGMAGLWDTWTDPDTHETVRSCTIVTCPSNAVVAAVHDRMPVILPEAAWDTWLDPKIQDAVTLQEFLVPFPAGRTQARRVSRVVNNPRHEGPTCQAPPQEEDC